MKTGSKAPQTKSQNPRVSDAPSQTKSQETSSGWEREQRFEKEPAQTTKREFGKKGEDEK